MSDDNFNPLAEPNLRAMSDLNSTLPTYLELAKALASERAKRVEAEATIEQTRARLLSPDIIEQVASVLGNVQLFGNASVDMDVLAESLTDEERRIHETTALEIVNTVMEGLS